MTETETETAYLISCGEYSDYSVHAVCHDRGVAEKIVEQLNAIGEGGYTGYEVEERRVITDPVLHTVTTRVMTCWIDGDGTVSRESDRTETEPEPDMMFPERNVPARVQWDARNGGGRLEVSGTSLERVAHVYGDQRAMLLADPLYRARPHFAHVVNRP